MKPKVTENVFEVKDGSGKKEMIVMACFGADGNIVKPQIVFAYERMPAIIRSSFPPSLHLSCSKSGLMNADLFLDIINVVFYSHILDKHGPNVPVILFVDEHSSNLSVEVGALCEEKNIILVQLYPNSTFLMQPADVSCFKLLNKMSGNER